MLYREYNLTTFITNKGDYSNLPNEKYKKVVRAIIKISYPIYNSFCRIIRFSSLYELIDKIKEIYEEIYQSKELIEKYGVWEYGIEKLVIKGIYINEDVVSLYIGS